MKSTFKKYCVSGLMALTVSMAYSGFANAAGPLSTITTASSTAVFSKTASASLNIQPKSGMLAGDYTDQESLGTVTVTAKTGVPIIRWTPGVGKIYSAKNSQTPNAVVVNGESSNTNHLSIYLDDDSHNYENNPTGQNWLIPENFTSDSLTFNLALDGAQHINADKYTISLDGAVWVN